MNGRMFLASILVLGVACGKKKAEKARLDSFPVKVSEVARRDVEETVLLVGSVKAKDEATLYSRVPGKLLKNLLREGERVKKGQSVCLVERDEVGVRFEPAPVPSTLDGVVARTYLDQGENVTLQTPVALVVDDSQTLARAELPERFAGRAQVGQDVRLRVDAWPGRVFRGRVIRVSPVVDPLTRTALVEARVDAGGRLRPGMFGEFVLVLGSRGKALSVQADAIVDGSGPAVFVVKDGKASKREIEVGLKGDLFVEVRAGLSEGEEIAVFGLYGLKDGSPVEVLPEASVPAGGGE